MARLPSAEEIEAADKALQPYFTALGKVAHSWNHLHEELGKIFCAVTQLDVFHGMAVWHSLKSDRSQRDILEGAILSRARAEEEDRYWDHDDDRPIKVKLHPEAKDGVLYLLKQVNKLAGRRNDAIHAPCFVPPRGDFEITPLSFFGNDKAQRLSGKDILMEFEWYEKTADALRRHAEEARLAIDAGLSTWPDKPQLPTVGQRHLDD